MAALFASQGYIVVAPNYAGYGSSALPYHPYLVADQQSKDMIDAFTAARSALPTAAAPATMDSGRLFITGVLAGRLRGNGDASAMQAAGLSVTAVRHRCPGLTPWQRSSTRFLPVVSVRVRRCQPPC